MGSLRAAEVGGGTASISPPPALRTIQNTGSSANRVDMIFLGDGYTASEIATTYTQHVDNYIDYIFNVLIA